MKPFVPQEKPLLWIGSAKKDLLAFPGEAVDDFGYALGVVQMGGMPPSAKPWKGEGPGVFEIVEDHRGDTYRVALHGAVCESGLCAALLPEEIAVRHTHGQERCGFDT